MFFVNKKQISHVLKNKALIWTNLSVFVPRSSYFCFKYQLDQFQQFLQNLLKHNLYRRDEKYLLTLRGTNLFNEKAITENRNNKLG